MDPSVRLRQALRALLVVSMLCLGLGAALAILTYRWQRDAEPASGRPAFNLEDPAVRKAAIAELVGHEPGGWDTFPDPEVGRVLQPGLVALKQDRGKMRIDSNDLGLREKEFRMPKPADTTRVVVLGDSFVFGQGVAADERFGALLQTYLTKNAPGTKQKIEVLHFGVTCWNIVAETAFLKRTLSLVQPDLVVHLIIRNDLEDNPGARGFGHLAHFDPLHGERGEPLFQGRFPEAFGRTRVNWIANGLDWESRARFEDAGRRIAELVGLIGRAGGRYLMVDYFVVDLPRSKKYFAATLKPEQVCYLPVELAQKDEWKVDDIHWNRIGNEVVAKALYGVIQSRGLLPQLGLAEWPEATAATHEWMSKGEAEANAEPTEELPLHRRIGSAIDFGALDNHTAAQVTGGVVPGGFTGPYAALTLASGGARHLRVHGHGLKRIELDGTKVDLFVEEAKVGSFTVNGGDTIDCDCAIPDEIAKRTYVAVRFVATDFAYAASDSRQFVVFALEKVELTKS